MKLASTAAATEVMVRLSCNIAQVGLITLVVASPCCARWWAASVAVPLVLTVIVSWHMGMLGIPLDTMTAAIAAMAIGIGADYDACAGPHP
jgi:predicted RND superfamily exporter protein